eukprot:COSAG06_NODE_5076_length_3743_cov_21.948957_2_plen_63_part_00
MSIVERQWQESEAKMEVQRKEMEVQRKEMEAKLEARLDRQQQDFKAARLQGAGVQIEASASL